MNMTPEQLAKRVNSIYSLPEVAMRVNELINDPNTNSFDLEEVIIHDPGLTTKILKFVNSAYFGFNKKVDRISYAITLIGQQELRNLVVSNSVIALFKGIPEKVIDMQSFWFHCITCGVLSRALARHCRYKNLEHFFIIGLLHNIGKLIFLCQFSEQYSTILSAAAKDEYAILAAEENLFGFSHPQLTAELLKQWQLPDSIWEVILNQYQPMEATDYRKETCILHLAAVLSEAIEPYTKEPTDLKTIQQAFDDSTWAIFNLDEKIIQDMVADSTLQIMEIMEIIQPGFSIIY